MKPHAIPETSKPWRTVRHEGFVYMVRKDADVTWVVRQETKDRPIAVWMFEPGAELDEFLRPPKADEQLELI